MYESELIYNLYHSIYRISHELSLNINFHETSLVSVIKEATGELYNISGTSFIEVNINMTTSVRYFYHMTFQGPAAGYIFHEFLACCS